MKVTIEFDTDNAAFAENFEMEITRVMKSAKEVLSESCNNTNIHRQLIDSYGNRIGSVAILQPAA